MMKKNKEILKQAGTMSLIYLILCLGGAYESYYRGADLRLCIAVYVCGNVDIYDKKRV